MKNTLKVLLFLILAAPFQEVNAQKPKDFYVSYPQPGGTLFHVFPATFFQHKTDGDFIFDMTYQCGKDSAVINFTYYAPRAEPLDSVCFATGKTLFAGEAEKLFIEAETIKKWAHRYSFKVSVTFLAFFFNLNEQPYVKLYMNSTTKDYELKKSEWNKKAPIYGTIMKTIGIECEK